MDGKGMPIDARDVLTTAEWFIAAGTLMTAIVVGVRKVYRLARNVEDTLNKLGKVEKLLMPNGGSSIHDRVARIEANTEANANRAEAAVQRLELLAAEHTSLNESVRDIHNRLHSLEVKK